MELRSVTCKCCTAPLDPEKAVGRVVRCEFCGTAFVLAREDEGEIVDLLRSGALLLDTCKFDEAYTAYAKTAELDSEEPEAYFGMALATFKVQYLKDEVNNRLQPICHEITEKRFCADKNYQQALRWATDAQREEYKRRGEEIDAIRGEFYALQRAGAQYDCFLCVKVSDGHGGTTQDSHEALLIYNHLKSRGFLPFYSEAEAGSRTGSDYEALILYALYTSRCMLIVCFEEAYLRTKWVKNEYTRFAAMIANEEKERDAMTFVFRGAPVERLPGKSGKIQGIDLSRPDAYTRIDSFVAGHLPAAEREERYGAPPRKPEVRQGEQRERGAGAAINVAPTASSLCARGYEKLKARDFAPARDLFERALNIAPENAEARWGAFLCDLRVAHENELGCSAGVLTEIRANGNYSAALRSAVGETRFRIERFCAAMAEQAETGIGDGEARLRDLRAEMQRQAERAEAGQSAIRKAEEEVKNFDLARKEWSKANGKYGIALVLFCVAAGAIFEVLFNLYVSLPLIWQIVAGIFGGLAGAVIGGAVLMFIIFLAFSPAISAADKRKKKKLSEKYSIPPAELTDDALKGDKKGTGKGISDAEKRLRQAKENMDAVRGEQNTVRAEFIRLADDDILYHQADVILSGGSAIGGEEAARLLPQDLKEDYLACLASGKAQETGNE